jgi:hypothetical protein
MKAQAAKKVLMGVDCNGAAVTAFSSPIEASGVSHSPISPSSHLRHTQLP